MSLSRRVALCASMALFAIQPLGSAALAEEPAEKSVLVVTISSLDGLMGDIAYLAEALGFPQAGQMGTMMASQYTEGLDDSRPVGIVIQSVGDEMRPLGILPVKDLGTFLEGMESQLGEPEDAGDGILELAGPVPVYIKESNGWAFVGQSTDDLKNTPADPSAMFEGADKKYDVSMKAHIQNIPKEMRDMALAQIKEGVEMGLDELDDEDTDIDAETQRKLVENSIRQWENMLEGLDTINFGWLTDAKNRKILSEMSMTAVEGTKLDRQMDLLKNAKSRFTGFAIDGAAVTMNTAGEMLPEDIESTINMIEPARKQMNEEIDGSDDLDSEAKPIAKRLANSILDVVVETVRTGKFDMGMSMVMDGNKMNMIAGAHIVDGGKLETHIKELAAIAESKGKSVKVTLNADQHAGVRFHTISIPVPEDEEDARKALGESVEVAIGVAKESAYVAVGKQGMALVRQGIDKSGGSQPIMPATLKVALTPIMKFAASMDEGNSMLAAIASGLEKTTEDLIMARVEPIDNGAKYEFEMREGVLNAIGEGIQASREDEIE